MLIQPDDETVATRLRWKWMHGLRGCTSDADERGESGYYERTNQALMSFLCRFAMFAWIMWIMPWIIGDGH